NNTHHISEGVTSIDVVILGAGGGGGSGQWDWIGDQAHSGTGGGGGGEVHTNIPRALVGDSLQIIVGAGGRGGHGSPDPGRGGGDTKVITAEGELVAGGGSGGLAGSAARGATVPGGSGMIRGGDGGAGG